MQNVSVDTFLGSDSEKQSLIKILNRIQDYYGYIPKEVITTLSHEIKVGIAKIYGVITFYSQYKLEKPGKYTIRVCGGTACHVKNSNMILNTMKYDFNILEGKTTKDGLFTVEKVSCLGACALAPITEINGEIHGEMTSKEIRRILKRIIREEEN